MRRMRYRKLYILRLSYVPFKHFLQVNAFIFGYPPVGGICELADVPVWG